MKVHRRRGVALFSLFAVVALPVYAASARRVADQPDESNLPQTHVIYAVAADGVDRKLDTNGAIETSTRSINEWLGGETNRHVRFDRVGNETDVTFLRLSRDAQTIIDATDAGAIDAFRKELDAVGLTSLTKVYAIYYDGAGPRCGLGQQQARIAVIFIETCGSAQQTWDFVPLHEILHAFGAVPAGAPHITGGSHVSDDLNDLMAPNVPIAPRIDVDRQDYFGHGVSTRFDLATTSFVEAATPFDLSSCQAAMVDTNFRATAIGGVSSTFVLSPRPCLWTLTGAPSWLSVSQMAGIGPALVTLTSARNDTPNVRQAILTLGANALLVTQYPGPDLLIVLETPTAGATVRGSFPISGWMFDRSSADGSAGVQAVDVWAYPDAGGGATYVGPMQLGIGRGDVAAYFQDARAAASGFLLPKATLPVGGYTLALFPLDRVSGRFETPKTVHITVAPIISQPLMWVDTPTTSTPLTALSPFVVGGWALDLADGAGPGVDAVHIWAYPSSGAAPLFVGAAATGVPRPDLAAVIGRASVTPCGFNMFGTLPAGTYQLVVYAHSVLTGIFNNVRVVTIIVK